MKTKEIIFFTALIIISIVVIEACETYNFRSNYKEANELMHKTKNTGAKLFLKAHFKNGYVCILRNTWKIDTVQNTVSGTGTLYDFNREIKLQGEIEIPIDSIAIFETNKKLTGTETGRLAGLSILAGVDIIAGIYCITNPKACFGSCPTFYKNENDNFHFADAEGFSSSISPSMEYADIDALNNRHLSDHTFTISMKNEALETHCVRDVKLLAFPRKEGERIYHSAGDDFYLCENIYPVSNATGAEGDISDLISNEDMIERFSLCDENNLSSKEEIILNFDNAGNYINPGLVIHFRQTLMTTYFIYSAMGYMGDEIGDFFAEMEVSKETINKLNGGIKKELGGIDVFVPDENNSKWIKSGSIFETGPIAVNKQILPLKIKTGSSDIKVKLVLNKGLWRIDYAALTDIKEKVKPLEISTYMILNKGKPDDAALALINDPCKHLISMPGSEYKFYFSLPEQYKDYELFLYSKGYYLEWMREQWIKDKDLLKLNQMIEHPLYYLRSQAKDYKIYETTMEQEFWNSKIDTKNFSYHEN
ncbi:MAG TPA: hypothetical protein PK536_10635 [Ignavibacteria bacterium]|nr:hypothetical protein [Bacteroidota bacterium]HRI85888.1 hypothetical protein [Ignavibacteria bacterium]HRK00948.1 hypothetical protein [Ignavibacteria bacterium]